MDENRISQGLNTMWSKNVSDQFVENILAFYNMLKYNEENFN